MTVTSGLPVADPERVALYRAQGLWHDRLLADGVEAAAARRPGAVALVDNTAALTFTQLADAVATGVELLAGDGLRAGDGVVLVSGNTRHGVIAYHALLRAGALIIALDRRCGAADLRAAVAALRGTTPGPVRVLLPADEAERLRDELAGTRTLRLESFEAGSSDAGALDAGTLEAGSFEAGSFEAASRAGTPPAVAAEATAGWVEPDRDRAAVVLFSSGTTGQPKGIVHSLNTLTAGARNMAAITGADSGTVCFLVSPLTSITGLMQLHLAADQQATLALEDQFAPERTLERMNSLGATLLGGAPVIAERLLGVARRLPPPGLSLRTLALGGAMLPRPLLELATDTFGIGIARVYGSSEAPNFSGSLPADDRERRLTDDGALMPGAEVRIGSSGDAREGLLRGPSLFLGYLRTRGPAGELPPDDAAFEDGWYRSGDQMELHDGRLTVVGRLKEVVNRNGLKISLPEVEAALATLPGLEEYAAFAVPDPSTGERLAVAVRPAAANAGPPTLDGVLAHLLAQGLARRKLPEQLVHWDGPLPRTASGKVVRSRLVMEAPARTSELAARLRGEPESGRPAPS